MKGSDVFKCSLRYLNLEGNDIGVNGCSELMTALCANQTVVELNLNLNPIENDGGMAIAEMLRVQNPL